MNTATVASPALTSAGAINAAEAGLLLKHLNEVMDTLLALIEEETKLVRAGRLSEAEQLETSKLELANLYLGDVERLKNSQAFLAKAMPEELAALRKRHDVFRALLQMNLTVLATAHAVSEGIMRGVSGELARKATPQGYGARGQRATPAASGLQPLAVSRVL